MTDLFEEILAENKVVEKVPHSICQIGTIVNSNSHIDYLCQVFGPVERKERPTPDAHAFGAFVAIALSDGAADQLPGMAASLDSPAAELIGVVYNTLLVNPDFGNLGPRLTSREEQAVFTPDLMDEKATLVGVLALGWRDADGPQQGVPRLAAEVGAAVRRLSDEEALQFHRDARGRLRLRYAATLLGLNNPLAPALLLEIIDRLHGLFPQEQAILQVMRNNVAWKAMVQPAG